MLNMLIIQTAIGYVMRINLHGACRRWKLEGIQTEMMTSIVTSVIGCCRKHR
jgi:hypothetical protein